MHFLAPAVSLFFFVGLSLSVALSSVVVRACELSFVREGRCGG